MTRRVDDPRKRRVNSMVIADVPRSHVLSFAQPAPTCTRRIPYFGAALLLRRTSLASIFLALAAAVSWGVSADFLGGLFTRRVALAPVLLISQAVGFGMLLVLATAVRGSPMLDVSSIGFAIGASGAGMVGIAALYRGMAVGVVSIVAPISATGAALPVVFGLLRGERAAPLQTMGIAVALVGIVLASRSAADKADSAGPIVARGVGLAILAAVGFGAFFILLHEASAVDVLWAG